MTETEPSRFIEAGDLFLLKGRYVYLQFLTEAHRETLRPLARDERIWEFTKTLLITDTYDRQFDQYFNEALSFAAKGDRAFAIVAAGDDRVIGMTRAYDIDHKVKRVTIRSIPGMFLPSGDRRTTKNVNYYCCSIFSIRLVLSGRILKWPVRISGHARKLPSAKIGVREGVLRRYALRNDGTPTDTFIFSILEDEWPEKKKRLQEMVAGAVE